MRAAIGLLVALLAGCGGGGSDKSTAPTLVVVGNSITRHPVALELGWTHESGMAASSEATDFAHVTGQRIGATSVAASNVSAAIEVDPVNGSALVGQLVVNVDAATVFVVQFGTNVQPGNAPAFLETFGRLLDAARTRTHRIVCVGAWRAPIADIDSSMRQACTMRGAAFVPIDDLRADPANRDYTEGPQYADPRVNSHPHDWTMGQIAGRIVAALPPAP